MRVGDGVGALVLWSDVLARPLGIADEEALLRSKPVAIGESLALGLVLPGHPRQDKASEIGDVLALGQLGVDLDVIDDGVLRVLVNDALRAVGEGLGVLFGPPVL